MDNFRCKKCGEYFKSKGALTRHQGSKSCISIDNMLFTCQKCNLQFKFFNDIKEHLINCNIEENKNNIPTSKIDPRAKKKNFFMNLN